MDIPDPLNGEVFIKCPDTQLHEIEPFVHSLKSVPKSGLHNPLKQPDRCAYAQATHMRRRHA
jgi:1-pyrroline-5-carboxylate dehydrogenase